MALLTFIMCLTPGWHFPIQGRVQSSKQSVFQTAVTVSAFNPGDVQVEWVYLVLQTPVVNVLTTRMMPGFGCVETERIGK
jgi:hypothetical protein